MEVRYRRELSETFLILEGDGQPDVYTARILKENRLDGVAASQIHWAEGRPEYWFAVSGCQTLRRLWESRQLRAGEVRELLLGLHRGLEQLEDYLLDLDRVLLEPDFLFVPEEGTGQVRLCCHPGWAGNFFDGLRSLVQYFLNKMDHGDSASVEMTYRLFQVVGKEFFCFDDLLEALDLPEGQEEKAPEEGEPWEPGEDFAPEGLAEEGEEGHFFPDQFSRKARRLARKDGKPRRFEQNHAERKHAGRKLAGKVSVPWAGFLAIPAVAAVFLLLRYLNLWQPPDQLAAVGLLLLSVALAGLAGIWLRRRPLRGRKAGTKEPEKEIPAELWEGKDRVTDFLPGAFSETAGERCLVSQNSLRHDTIRIRQLPFILGKMEDVCDYPLRYPVISRIHARLEQQDGQIYLVDCNSTNGTYLNGVRLEPNRRYPVQAGDEIMLADLKYLFQ